MKTFTNYEIWYDWNTSPSEQAKLKSGSQYVVYQASDLRYIRFGGVELVHRIYAPIPNLNWNEHRKRNF